MEYEFSFGAFFVGLLILAAGVAFVRYYRVIADNFGSGVASYEHYRLYAFITCGLGLVVMVNLHALILGAIADSLFRR